MRPFTLLLVVAGVLLGCSSGVPATNTASPDSPLDSLRAENERLHDRIRVLRDSLRLRDDIETGQYYRDLRTLQDQLTRLSYQAQLFRSGGLTVAVVPADVLFASVDSLSETGGARLDSIASHLHRAYPDRTVWVEGHADDTPLSGTLADRFPSNWELSAARAATVVRGLLERTSLNRRQFVAAGYGATRPRASNDTAQGRRRNRRIRIAVLPQPQTYSAPFEDSW